MANLRKAKKYRTALRGWVTRQSSALLTLLSKTPPCTLVELNDAMDQFDQYLNKLDDQQTEVELLIGEEADLLEDLEQAADFRDKARVPRIKATELHNSLSPSNAAQPSASSMSVATPQAKLPKLNLPKFSGDVLQWEAFWDIFKATVDDSDLSEVTKFTYLKASLEGDAARAIGGISLTSDNYASALAILQERYGRKERIIFSHINQLLSLQIPPKCTINSLRALNDTLLAHTRSLENLGIVGSQYGVILTPLILSRLPQEVRLEWSREAEGKESDLSFLLDFLKKEVQRRDRSFVIRDPTYGPSSTLPETKKSPPSAAALKAGSSAYPSPQTFNTNPRSRACGICNHRHTTDRCWKLTREADLARRVTRVKEAKLCFVCLKPQHASLCSTPCSKCGGPHHVLLCSVKSQPAAGVPSAPLSVLSEAATTERQSPAASATPRNATVMTAAHAPPPDTRVLLMSARVTVCGSKGNAPATVIFDTGSDRSYVRKEFAQKVGLTLSRKESVSFAAFGSSNPGDSALRNVFSCILQDLDGSDQTIAVTEVPVICTPLHRPEVPTYILDKVPGRLADTYSSSEQVVVDILIGLDWFWQFMKPYVIQVSERLVAQDTVFGFILSGCVSTVSSGPSVAHQLLCLDSIVTSFWELDSIGITEKAHPVLEEFNEQVKMVDDRFEVGLPWKPDMKSLLLNNVHLARKRLDGLSRRLRAVPALKARYDGVLQDLLNREIIEKVPVSQLVPDDPSRPVFYMPHRPIIKEQAVSTKCRPVFDASAKGYNRVSLNDCMEVGPCLLSNLTEVLVRFRRWKIALTSDIEKAFLQISVTDVDRDVHRFLWENDGEVQVMRFRRLPFGNCASPFLLIATIQHHLSTLPDSRIVQELGQNMYMDNLLTGADTVEESCAMIHEASEIMSRASMTLRQWASNNPEVGALLSVEFGDKMLEDDSIHVLGMIWVASADLLSFKGPVIEPGLVITKRVVLSYFSKLFDPLGLVAPFVMLAKCLFQELWSLGLGWDDEVAEEYQLRFLRWIGDLDVLRDWSVPRCYTPVGWSGVTEFVLHGFGDASPKGYGACVYLVSRLSDGTCVSSLVIAKAKLAPLKGQTLPRLELLACLLCARLIQFVREALQLPPTVKYRCWSDSTIALAWLQGNPGRWKPWVANRVKEIRKLTSAHCWSWCPTEENSADLLTRGITADELVSSYKWLHGPSFVLNQLSVWEEVSFTECDQDVLRAESLTTNTTLTAAVLPSVVVFDVERWGRFTKAIRVVAWVLRFIKNLKRSAVDRLTQDLSLQELVEAKSVLIKEVQRVSYQEEITSLQQGRAQSRQSSLFKLAPFLASDGLLRVQGRLHLSALSYEEKHPIIIPRGHFALLYVRFMHELLKHAGVQTLITTIRNDFWIQGVRGIAKSVKKYCIPCQRQDARAGGEVMPPLPSVRVTQAAPFQVSGVDHAGPLYCEDFPLKKFYILLITCAVTRAVQFELVDSLSGFTTALAIRRLTARRGLPRIIYSDNHKGFQKCSEVLVTLFGPGAPEWRFTAPYSPWRGGWWERLVRSCKAALRKSLGKKSVSREELETTLHEAEACVNSRPLTFVSDEVESTEPLTPAHFLLGHNRGFYSSSSPDTQCDLSASLKCQKCSLSRFWKVWSAEYIRSLPSCKGTAKPGIFKPGSLVLLEEGGTPRLEWPLGVVEQVLPSRDGLVRTVQVRTKKGKYIRSVPRIRPLELAGGDSDALATEYKRSVQVKAKTNPQPRDVVNAIMDAPAPYRTRAGRISKPVLGR